MQLGESMEDYLEAILVLSKCLDHVRSVDVASYLGFSKPSVSHAVKLLSEQGLRCSVNHYEFAALCVGLFWRREKKKGDKSALL